MRKVLLMLACFMVLGGSVYSHAATNTDYCAFPIFATNAVKPNVMIDMDLSGSMQFAGYIACDLKNYKSSPYNGAYSCVPSTSNSNYSTMKYDTARTYYGYFDSTKCYAYSSTNGRFEVNSAGTCTTDMIGSAGDISGNLLNWIATTRLDVVRKALTGGRTYASDTLQSEGTEFNTSISGTCDSGYVKYFKDTTTGCRFSISNYNGYSYLRRLKAEDDPACAIGTFSNYNIRVKVEDASTIKGIVDDFYDRVAFEFMGFNSNSGMLGQIFSGKTATLSSLKNQINTSVAVQGTPTGNSLRAANNFFRQSQYYTSSVASNTSYISKADGDIDPYYDKSGGTNYAVPCRRAFILLFSDGQWSDGYVDPARSANELHVNDLRSELAGTQNVNVYTIYAFGDQDATAKLQGRRAMITTAIFGGFDFSDTDKIPYGFSGLPSDSRYVNYPITGCDPAGTWSEQCREWDKDKTGLPYNFYEADEGDTIITSISNALNDMLRKSSSGTAASVLASAEGSGANILQALFFPKRKFDNAEVDWTGEMQNLWYYIDPQIGGSTIREDTAKNNVLDIYSDDIIAFEFDVGLGKTMVRRYQPDSYGLPGAEDSPSPVDIDEVKNLWEAGIILWSRDITTSPRTIYTTLDGKTLTNFSAAEASSNATLQTYLQAADAAEAQSVVSYIHGDDVVGYRSRMVKTAYQGTTDTRVWKLGDIVSSTPRLKGPFPLNSFHKYPPDGYNDRTYYQYINDIDASGNPTGIYKQRGMTFVGANDGMLHAFELGKLTFTGLTSGTAARLETVDVPLGSERWAFVPKGALPYLKYLMNTNYCHMFLVDQPATIFDASINAGGSLTQDPYYTKTRGSWRTIIIGGMGTGGACRDTASTCTDCVKTPVSGVGYSSYFAFDITDPVNPKLLWEFSRSDLGFSTTGPAIVRVGDPTKNGKWFAVFASGPTGPIDTTDNQFMGSSDQNLKLFVLDLMAGPDSTVYTIDTGITNAFGGSLYHSAIDIDKGDPNKSGASPYTDDLIYMGYTKKDGTTWTKGGVVRIMTKGDMNPNNWVVSKLIDNIGPVTSGIARIQDRKNGKFWIYFGTGRYYYRLDDGLTLDDPDSQQAFYGIKEPCYQSSNILDTSCITQVVAGDLQNQTGSSSDLGSDKLGWYINFPTPEIGYKAHRVLAQPTASFSGLVYFLTSSPSTDVCSFGGNTYVWVVKYNNGGAPQASELSGLILMQLSTGKIANISLKNVDGTSSLTLSGSGNKATLGKEGIVKGDGLSVLAPPRPLRKILHMKEK